MPTYRRPRKPRPPKESTMQDILEKRERERREAVRKIRERMTERKASAAKQSVQVSAAKLKKNKHKAKYRNGDNILFCARCNKLVSTNRLECDCPDCHIPMYPTGLIRKTWKTLNDEEKADLLRKKKMEKEEEANSRFSALQEDEKKKKKKAKEKADRENALKVREEQLCELTQNGAIRWKMIAADSMEVEYESVRYIMRQDAEIDSYTLRTPADGTEIQEAAGGLIDRMWTEARRSMVKPNTAEQVHRPVKHISVADFLVRTSLYRCIHAAHNLEDITAVINIVGRDGKVSPHQFRAAYCPECDLHYIMEPVYQDLKKLGILQCYVVEKEKYKKDWKKMRKEVPGESALMRAGYNVRAAVGYTDEQRRAILAGVIDGNVLTPAAIISYLTLFAAQKRGVPGYEAAVAKWDMDTEFVRNRSIATTSKAYVRSIERTKYREAGSDVEMAEAKTD